MCNEDLARLRAALRASNVTAPAVNSEAGWATCSDLATGDGLGDELDWKNLSPDDAQRLLVLSFSIFMSYCSIVKTAYGVSKYRYEDFLK